MTMQELLKENRAFAYYAKQTYSEHPIGSLLLGLELYESCRVNSNSIAWNIMQAAGHKTFTSEAFLDAANQVLKLTKELKNEEL